jgi:lysophospholipase L1-like esterase
MPEVVLIGDSIRMGYQDVVAEELAGLADIWFPKENGGTSANVLEHLDEWVIRRRPDVVHINCGLHDLRVERGSTERSIPLAQYRENLAAIFSRINEQTSAITIWATSTPVNEQWHRARKDFDRCEADVEEYNRTSTEVAHSAGAIINDLYQLVMEEGRDRMLSEDGVHFKLTAYRRLGRAVARAVREHLPSVG